MNILGLIDISNWILIPAAVFITFYVYMTWNNDIFKKLNIPYAKPWPILGDLVYMYTEKKPLDRERELLERFREEKCYGTFLFHTPMLVVKDPNMLKQIFIKEFDSFVNRRKINPDIYPMRAALTSIMDDHWKHVRNILTPTFSAGKLKLMMSQLNRSAAQLARNLGKKADENEVINLRDYTGAYTMDVIAGTGFGLQIDSQTNKDDPFVKYAQMAFDISIFKPAVLLILFFPFMASVFRWINYSIFPMKCVNFFVNTVDQAIERKKEMNMTQKDLLQLMLDKYVPDPEKNDPNRRHDPSGTVWTTKGLTKEEILGQSLIFLLGGYDTTAKTLAFVGYNLATNPEVQDKLIDEIDRIIGNEGEPTYENLAQMEYLEMCINETLRIYPPAARHGRVAKRDIVIDGVKIPKDMMVLIPNYAIHHDPSIWEEPEVFRPERFRPENKSEHFQYQWMPFGAGPRNCVGMRLALAEAKVALIHVLQKYKFVTCVDTEIPLKLEMKTLLGDKNGIKLKMERRVKTS